MVTNIQEISDLSSDVPLTTTGASSRAGRLASATVVACVLLHGALLAVTGGTMLSMSVPLLALSLVCASCVHALWHGSKTHAWWMMSACAAAMIVLHLVIGDHNSSSGHMHGAMEMGGEEPSGGVADALMTAGLALASFQLTIAGFAAVLRLERTARN